MSKMPSIPELETVTKTKPQTVWVVVKSERGFATKWRLLLPLIGIPLLLTLLWWFPQWIQKHSQEEHRQDMVNVSAECGYRIKEALEIGDPTANGNLEISACIRRGQIHSYVLLCRIKDVPKSLSGCIDTKDCWGEADIPNPDYAFSDKAKDNLHVAYAYDKLNIPKGSKASADHWVATDHSMCDAVVPLQPDPTMLDKLTKIASKIQDR